MSWFLYLIECSDASIYTGIAVDVQARYQQHLDGKGARYTRSHPPQRLLASFAVPNRSIASRLEYHVKRLSPAQKRALADGTLPLPLAQPALPNGDNDNGDADE